MLFILTYFQLQINSLTFMEYRLLPFIRIRFLEVVGQLKEEVALSFYYFSSRNYHLTIIFH